MQEYKLRLENKISELDKIRDALEEMAAAWGLPPQVSMSVNLALEEAFTNIVNYAYDDDGRHEITLDFHMRDNELHIAIRDGGRPYDPTVQDEPDIALPATDRPIGGLGIFLIKKIMNEIRYERKDDKNQLFLKKTLTQ